MKILHQGSVILFFVLVAGFMGIQPVGATEGGSFEIPDINDDFNQVKPGPPPAKETPVTETRQEKGFFDKVGDFFSGTWEKTKQGVKKATDWIVSKAKWLIRLIPIIPIILNPTTLKVAAGAIVTTFVTVTIYAYFRRTPPDFDKLWKIVDKQYSLAFFRVDKKILLEKVLVSEKSTIKVAGEKYDVPPEIIAAIIVKEQITQSLPDELAIIDTWFTGNQHSMGLGAVFPKTAKRAWVTVDPARAYLHGMYKSSAEISNNLMWNKKVRIDTIAVVLNYYARKEYKTENVSTLTLDEWKQVVGRYNAEDSDKQREYSDKVWEYLDSVRDILK